MTQLPEPIETKSEATFDAPSILFGVLIVGGVVTHSVREGGARQTDLFTRIEWSDSPVDEHDQVFGIRAQNQIRFAGQTISVINDEIHKPELILPATEPSATEYLEAIGQRKLIHFDCTRDEMESARLARPVFKVVRNFIVLP